MNLTTIQEYIIYILYKPELTVGRGSANNQVNPFMSADSCPILSPLDPIMYPVRIMNQLCSELDPIVLHKGTMIPLNNKPGTITI